MYKRSSQSPRAQSLHSRRRRPPLVRPERATRLRFRTQESLEEIHYIVHAPPAYHYSLDGFADEEVEENWEAEELTVPELRAALSKRRLPTSGRKMDLVERLSGALQRERTERRQDAGAAKRRKLDDILSAQQEEMEDRLEASNLAAPPHTSTSTSTTTATTTDDDDRDANNDTTTTNSSSSSSTTNFSFFFNSLEAESSSPPSSSSSSAEPSSSSSSSSNNGHGGSSRKRKAPCEENGEQLEAKEEKEREKEKEKEKEKEASGEAPACSGSRFTWGAKEEADGGEDGLVSKLTRFLEQVPSSPSRAAAAAQRKPELLPEDLLPAAAACSSLVVAPAASTPPTSAAPALPISSPPASPMRRPLKGVLKKREVKAPEDMTAVELKEHLIAYGVAGAALKQKKAVLVTLLHKTIQQHASKKASA